MSIEKIIIVKAKIDQAVKDTSKLHDELTNLDSASKKTSDSAASLGDTYSDASKKAAKGLSDVGNSADKTSKKTSSLSGSVKGFGLALKATGIGFMLTLVAKFTETLSKNEKVTESLSRVFTTLGIVFSDVIEKGTSLLSVIYQSNDGFKALSKVIGGVLSNAVESLKIGINSMSLAISYAQLAWEESFFGDKDPETIKELNKKISETTDSLVASGKKIKENAKDIYNNIGNAAKEVFNGAVQLAKGTAKIISQVNVQSAAEQAKMLAQSRKNIEIVTLAQERLVQKYTSEIGIIKQIRDNQNVSFKERIQASKQLESLIEKQVKAEKSALLAKISNLQLEQKLLGVTTEKTNEIYRLQTELLAVEQRFKEAQKERLVVEKQVFQEEQQMLETSLKGAKNREFLQKEFQAGLQHDTLKRIAMERDRISAQDAFDQQELERKRALYKESTQARMDAEQDYLNKKQELNNQLTSLEIQETEERFRRNFENEQLVVDNNRLSFQTRYEALQEQSRLILENELLSEEERTKALRQNSESRIKIERAEFEAKQAILGATGNAIGAFSDLLGKETAEGKFLAAASALISTYQGIASSLKVGGFVGIAQAVAVGAMGFKAVKDIYAVQVPNDTTGSFTSDTTSITAPSVPPQFNIVGASPNNQLAEVFSDQKPQKAYVVSSEVSTQQALDRSVTTNASFGFDKPAA